MFNKWYSDIVLTVTLDRMTVWRS